MGINWNVDNKTGSDCSGANGSLNRVLTLANTSLTIQSEFNVFVSGLELTLTTEYTVVHNLSGTQITFLNGLWNDMTVIIRYSQGVANCFDNITENKLGSDCSGVSGASNRILTLANTTRTIQTGLIVSASGLSLAYGAEYTAVQNTVSSTITFLNPLWNDMEIEVKYLKYNGVITFTDGLTLLDVLLRDLIRILNDTLILSDSENFDISTIKTDILTLLDTFGRNWSTERTYSETLTIEDLDVETMLGKMLLEIITLHENLQVSISPDLILFAENVLPTMLLSDNFKPDILLADNSIPTMIEASSV
jgi:hypothetical protein